MLVIVRSDPLVTGLGVSCRPNKGCVATAGQALPWGFDRRGRTQPSPSRLYYLPVALEDPEAVVAIAGQDVGGPILDEGLNAPEVIS